MKKKKKKYQPFSIEKQIPFLSALNRNNKLALFLGAGVSKGCGLPDWESLLLSLKRKLEIKGCQVNETDDIATLARTHFGNNFNKEVADSLYQNGLEITSTITSIAKSGIKKIACFNFDDILEEALSTECIQHKVVLNGESFNINKRNITVFHPHGYLGRFDTDKEYVNSNIVLSKTDYDSLYKNHYCLTNLIQISFLLNHSVLFVGMSLTDPNTLRLLKKAREVGSRHWHYALFKCTEKEIQRKETNKLRKLGVDPIWFRCYSDLPKIFKRIKTKS